MLCYHQCSREEEPGPLGQLDQLDIGDTAGRPDDMAELVRLVYLDIQDVWDLRGHREWKVRLYIYDSHNANPTQCSLANAVTSFTL